MARRPMTHAAALDSWRVDGELNGGHTVQQTLSFINELQDVEDERRPPLPMGVILAGDGMEPRWLGRLRRLFGR